MSSSFVALITGNARKKFKIFISQEKAQNTNFSENFQAQPYFYIDEKYQLSRDS